MTFLELVRRIQDACSEPQAAAAIGAPAGSLDEKFANFALRAIRQGAIWTDWPWDALETSVTATLVPTEFTLGPALRKVSAVWFNGTPLNVQFTYDDLRNTYASQLDLAPAGVPMYAALKNDTTLFVWPAPSVGGATALVVRGYRVPTVPVTDIDPLVGPPEYHDALVVLGQSYAVREHFGNASEADSDFARAQQMLRSVDVSYRKSPARPRWRY